MTTNNFDLGTEYGTDLSSRKRASECRQRLLKEIETKSLVTVSFESVRTVSTSFADEVFGILAHKFGKEWFRENLQLVGLESPVRKQVLEAVSERLKNSDLIDFARQWKGMNAAHLEQRVAKWDSRYGLLFVGTDEQASSGIEAMIEFLKPDNQIRLDDQTLPQFREQTAFLFAESTQLNLLESEPERTVVVTPKIDELTEKFYVLLKGLFERSKKPIVLLASASDEKRVPDYLRSHYFVFHASTNLRKRADVYKRLSEPEPS